MASSFSFSPDEAQKSLIQDGYFAVPNADVGRDALDFEDKSIPFLTPFGLDFCVQSSWDNESVRAVITASVIHPHLNLLKVYGNGLPRGFIYRFRTYNGTPRLGLLIQLWSPDSKIILPKGHHELPLRQQDIDQEVSELYGLLASPHEHKQEDIVTMSTGGLVLMDINMGFGILKGFVIIIGFIAEAELHSWAKMELPPSDAMKAKVTELSKRINIHYKWMDRA